MLQILIATLASFWWPKIALVLRLRSFLQDTLQAYQEDSLGCTELPKLGATIQLISCFMLLFVAQFYL